jgi:hypothetical protein
MARTGVAYDFEVVMAFLKTVVAFPLVAAGNEGEAIRWIADQLWAELGYTTDVNEVAELRSALAGGGEQEWGALGPDEESLVAEMRRSLAKVAAAAGTARPDGVAKRGVRAALDGAELVMRGELARGNAGHLPALMPSFVFLVTLPIAGQDTALRISKRASELAEETLGG